MVGMLVAHEAGCVQAVVSGANAYTIAKGAVDAVRRASQGKFRQGSGAAQRKLRCRSRGQLVQRRRGRHKHRHSLVSTRDDDLNVLPRHEN